MTQPNNKECVLPYCYNDDRASEKVYWKNQWKNTRYTTIFSVEMAASVENYLQALPKL